MKKILLLIPLAVEVWFMQFQIKWAKDLGTLEKLRQRDIRIGEKMDKIEKENQ